MLKSISYIKSKTCLGASIVILKKGLLDRRHIEVYLIYGEYRNLLSIV